MLQALRIINWVLRGTRVARIKWICSKWGFSSGIHLVVDYSSKIHCKMLLWHTLLIFRGWLRRWRHLHSLINILIGPPLTLPFLSTALFNVLLSSRLLQIVDNMKYTSMESILFLVMWCFVESCHNRYLLRCHDCCYISLLITHFLFLFVLPCSVTDQSDARKRAEVCSARAHRAEVRFQLLRTAHS